MKNRQRLIVIMFVAGFLTAAILILRDVSTNSSWTATHTGLVFLAITCLAGIGIVVEQASQAARIKSARTAAGKMIGKDVETVADELLELEKSLERIQKKLVEARLRERVIVDNANDIICSFDKTGKFIAANQAAERVWGHSGAALRGRSYQEFVHEEDLGKTGEALAKAMESRRGLIFENRIRCVDGRFADMLWTAQWSGTEQTVFCVAKDISSQKEIERIRESLVATVSHELRTPLSSLKWLITIMLQGGYGEISQKAKDKLEGSENTLDRLITLINTLLDIQKMDAGKFETHKEPVKVSLLVKQSVDSVEELATANGVNINFDNGIDATIVADKAQIEQVLVNFLSNAIKFSPNGESIEVSVKRTPENWLELSVTDHGRGIPPKQHRQIFEPFHQASRDKGGSGLGLAICKRIIEAHNGEIGVRSQENTGSTFWFRLPPAANGTSATEQPQA